MTSRSQKKWYICISDSYFLLMAQNSFYTEIDSTSYRSNYQLGNDLLLFTSDQGQDSSFTEKTFNKGMFVLFVCVDGEIEMLYGQDSKTLQVGDVGIAQTGSIGGLVRMSQNAGFIAILASEQFFKPIISPEELSMLSSMIVQYPFVHLPERKWSQLLTLCHLLKDMLADTLPKPFHEQSLKGVFQSIFYLVLSEADFQNVPSVPQASTHVEEVFQQFISLVQKFYAKEKHMAFYARELNITPKYLSQLVFQASGKHASVYIEQYRLNEAKSLVYNTNLTIQQICDRLHFCSESYFCRYFKKMTGYSPQDYRKQK